MSEFYDDKFNVNKWFEKQLESFDLEEQSYSSFEDRKSDLINKNTSNATNDTQKVKNTDNY